MIKDEFRASEVVAMLEFNCQVDQPVEALFPNQSEATTFAFNTPSLKFAFRSSIAPFQVPLKVIFVLQFTGLPINSSWTNDVPFKIESIELAYISVEFVITLPPCS